MHLSMDLTILGTTDAEIHMFRNRRDGLSRSTTTLRELESNGSASKTCELSEILGTDIALFHLEVVVDGLG